MLRKLFLFTLSLVAFASLNAQNLQLHFDPRHSLYGDNINAPINYLTATFEMLNPMRGVQHLCSLISTLILTKEIRDWRMQRLRALSKSAIFR